MPLFQLMFNDFTYSYCQINPPECLRSPRHTREMQVLDIPVCLEASATDTNYLQILVIL